MCCSSEEEEEEDLVRPETQQTFHVEDETPHEQSHDQQDNSIDQLYDKNQPVGAETDDRAKSRLVLEMVEEEGEGTETQEPVHIEGNNVAIVPRVSDQAQESKIHENRANQELDSGQHVQFGSQTRLM